MTLFKKYCFEVLVGGGDDDNDVSLHVEHDQNLMLVCLFD